MISIRETLEAKAWALELTYSEYVANHEQEFVTPPMDEQAYAEFITMMNSWFKRAVGE